MDDQDHLETVPETSAQWWNVHLLSHMANGSTFGRLGS